MSELLLNYKYFIGIILFTFLLIVAYSKGHKKNIMLMRNISAVLENILIPSEKTYTWLGGVTGFSADFMAKGLQKIKAVLTLLPRQSLLYLPVTLLKGSEDRLQLLFFLNEKISEEYHIVTLGKRPPHIYNRKALKSMKEKHHEMECEILYKSNSSHARDIINTISHSLRHIKHIAFTPDNAVLYFDVSLKSLTLTELEQFLKNILSFLKISRVF